MPELYPSEFLPKIKTIIIPPLLNSSSNIKNENISNSNNIFNNNSRVAVDDDIYHSSDSESDSDIDIGQQSYLNIGSNIINKSNFDFPSDSDSDSDLDSFDDSNSISFDNDFGSFKETDNDKSIFGNTLNNSNNINSETFSHYTQSLQEKLMNLSKQCGQMKNTLNESSLSDFISNRDSANRHSTNNIYNNNNTNSNNNSNNNSRSDINIFNKSYLDDLLSGNLNDRNTVTSTISNSSQNPFISNTLLPTIVPSKFSYNRLPSSSSSLGERDLQKESDIIERNIMARISERERQRNFREDRNRIQLSKYGSSNGFDSNDIYSKFYQESDSDFAESEDDEIIPTFHYRRSTSSNLNKRRSYGSGDSNDSINSNNNVNNGNSLDNSYESPNGIFNSLDDEDKISVKALLYDIIKRQNNNSNNNSNSSNENEKDRQNNRKREREVDESVVENRMKKSSDLLNNSIKVEKKDKQLLFSSDITPATTTTTTSSNSSPLKKKKKLVLNRTFILKVNNEIQLKESFIEDTE